MPSAEVGSLLGTGGLDRRNVGAERSRDLAELPLQILRVALALDEQRPAPVGPPLDAEGLLPEEVEMLAELTQQKKYSKVGPPEKREVMGIK